ncbi:MAG: seg [Candidatus Woesebacteria bacterium GW2011_GWC1_43_10b]|uniref:Seg n=1 Tax=Candidatus Woesebacteria bacterium GW2011_GWC1_43_10b TaxID=1618585 RepID=A0A0G1C5D9_9BACT|nr:MAG: seg [Candidatus Woesebacteria bacterium GW2011_GWC1_43_10b]
MIDVSVYKQGNYPIGVKKIKDTVKQTLESQGVVSDSQVEIAIVGQKKMAELIKEFYQEDKDLYAHPVLSFPASETQGQFVFPPDGKIHLGEVVVSYPLALEITKKENRLIDEVVSELVEHGMLHLLGIHHN